MKNRVYMSILIATLCLATEASYGEACTSDMLAKKSLVASLYKSFPVTKNGVGDKSVIGQKSTVLMKFFDNKLTSAFIRDEKCTDGGGICGLDFDPIYASQDPQVDKISLVCDKDNITALLYSFEDKNKPIRLIYKFKKESNGWRIDDIRYADKSSLQEFLKGD